MGHETGRETHHDGRPLLRGRCEVSKDEPEPIFPPKGKVWVTEMGWYRRTCYHMDARCVEKAFRFRDAAGVSARDLPDAREMGLVPCRKCGRLQRPKEGAGDSRSCPR